MNIKVTAQNGVNIAVVRAEEVIIADGQSALDFMMTVRYETDCSRIALSKEAVAEDFFILSTNLAGEILQKFVNYRFKLAIIGDFSVYTSKPLHDFIYECNSGQNIFFVASEPEAIDRLSAAPMS